MKRVCRQVSIESPNLQEDCVFNFDVSVPDIPDLGARVRVVYAGACYRMNRSISVTTFGTLSEDLKGIFVNKPLQQQQSAPSTAPSPARSGMRDGALFPGFEVAGVIEALGCDINEDNSKGAFVGQRVIIYPYEGIPHGYSELIAVPKLQFLVPIPDNLSLSVAAMLPSGALLAKSAILTAHNMVLSTMKNRGEQGVCKILIVGTGGLALWAVRIAAHHFHQSYSKERIAITVASLKDEGLQLAKEIDNVNVVQWKEELHEEQLVERTLDACKGPVDIVLDFCTTSRSLTRSLRCLVKGGVVLISEETGKFLVPKFSRLIEESEQYIQVVEIGSIELLAELVNLVASNEIKPPPHSVFPKEEAAEVIKKLCKSEIPGRAILKFHDIE